MSERADRPNRWPWPPLIYSAAIVLALLLTAVQRLPWFGAPLKDILFIVGVLMMIGAVALDLYAMFTLNAAKTTIWPNRGSDHFTAAGPYRFTRNPIYVGNTALMIGTGLAFGMVWFIGLAFVAAWLTQKLAILREEIHLETRFGKHYRDYKKKVRRWI
ncbi:MAG: isoprenylcysteine carboxylmethyltransferase family protein [Phyllobacteriaceae bacterium]|nr:isoprenylcysteine carboxylmethyltransferase family protein [Phyllobacteriaceae bacterium]